MTRAIAILIALLLGPVQALAQTVLRVSSPAPEGSVWANEARVFGKEIERRTNGRVKVKWYFGSIAGNDLEVGDRIRKGQLDGSLSGGPLCAQVMPSFRVLQLPGLFRDVNEARQVINQLSATLAVEAEQAGYVYFQSTPLGSTAYFGRKPVESFAQMRTNRLWVWDAETTLTAMLREMGLPVVPAPVERAGREFEAGKIDAFWAIPTATLAFQWAPHAPYLLDLVAEHVFGCVLIANRVTLGLSSEDQRQIRAASAEFRDRVTEASQHQERALLQGAFRHQGVTISKPSAKLADEFFATASAARDRIAAKLISPELLQRVNDWLRESRSGHAKSN
jgi:TRAP-type C4-dicarboxylate transport system substrate-binding protein